MLSAEDDSMSVVSNIDSADSNYSVGRGAEPQLMSMGIYKVTSPRHNFTLIEI